MSATDWLRRLLIGDTSWLFLVEVVYRAVIVYVFLLIAMRLMGKRMAAQLGIAELAVILMLGAAISAPIQMPTQGVLPAVAVLATIATLHRGLSWWSFRSSRVEVRVHGDPIVLLTDGRLHMGHLADTKISNEMLMSELRARGIRELGELHRVYLEPAGGFSLVYPANPRPGLSIAPDDDDDVWGVKAMAGSRVCARCGATFREGQTACTECGNGRTCVAHLPI